MNVVECWNKSFTVSGWEMNCIVQRMLRNYCSPRICIASYDWESDKMYIFWNCWLLESFWWLKSQYVGWYATNLDILHTMPRFINTLKTLVHTAHFPFCGSAPSWSIYLYFASMLDYVFVYILWLMAPFILYDALHFHSFQDFNPLDFMGGVRYDDIRYLPIFWTVFW